MSENRGARSWQGNRWGGSKFGGGRRGGGNWRGRRNWNRNGYGNNRSGNSRGYGSGNRGRNADWDDGPRQDLEMHDENGAENFPTDFHSRNFDGPEDLRDDGSNAFSVPESEISDAGSFRNPALNFVVESNALDLLCPFKGWPMYFPNEHYGGDKCEAQILIEACIKYLKSFADIYDPEAICEDSEFFVDIQDFIKAEVLTNSVENVAQKIVDRPELFIRCLGIAMYNLVLQVNESQLGSEPNASGENIPAENQSKFRPLLVDQIYARLINHFVSTPMRELRAASFGKLVSIRGTVVKVSRCRPVSTQMEFKCIRCDARQVLLLADGRYVTPVKCSNSECRSNGFVAIRNTQFSQTSIVDSQSIKLQEIQSFNSAEKGRIPRRIDCELHADLVDSCTPGEIVTVVGIMKIAAAYGSSRRGSGKERAMFNLYVHANSVLPEREKSFGVDADNGTYDDDMAGFHEQDFYAIRQVKSLPNLFARLVNSLCPEIYGHEMIKAGLLLALFGGRDHSRDSKEEIPIRNNIHMLIVGDPGLGKSQMLQSAANAAPLGIYVCGNTSTVSGLTVTISKDSGSNDFALEAGALVMGDRGICCIDEFDKMTTQHPALLEAMEQQCVSIAKGGIICNLPARTSILSAANPTGGHYQKNKSISENLKISPALLSRFDLVFILVDRPDPAKDRLLSMHLMALHAQKKDPRANFPATEIPSPNDPSASPMSMADALIRMEAIQRSTSCVQFDAIQGDQNDDGNHSLIERLRFSGNEIDPIPHPILTVFIAYAKRYVNPRLSTAAAARLQKFYVEMRKRHMSFDSTPITTRQLESLIRLTEARAKAELREIAEESDAKDVIEILKHSMVDTFADSNGMLDFGRSQHGSGMSQKAQVKRFLAGLQRIAEEEGSKIFSLQQLKEISQHLQLHFKDFGDVIESLNHQGYLLAKGMRKYQLQIVE